MQHSVLISDFDGTMTENDFYKLVAERLLPAQALEFWQEYRRGRISHFKALQNIFSQLRAPQKVLEELILDMHLDPSLAKDIVCLRKAGWKVVVASAGCQWYIDRLLTGAGLTIGPQGDVEVHANPGTYSSGTGLTMTMPEDLQFRSQETGVHKAAIVHYYLQNAHQVAYAGDGWTDVDAAMLVPPHLRFAKADLKQALDERGEQARIFTHWSEVARTIVELE
jgi:2,3-diketo-5-methylthio-1-phosphopentane phosphatase